MARSFRKALVLLLGTLGASGMARAVPEPPPAGAPAAATAPAATASATAAAPAHAPPLTSSQLPITVDAASSQVDYKTNTIEFKQVAIAQGAMRVQADHAQATGLNFANSRWTFDGNVKIDAEQRGSLRSDQAVVEFKDNRIMRATINGKPAEFEQQRSDSGQLARGHANQIVYDVNEGTVRLAEDAWLTDGQNEISGPLLVYDVRAQRVQAASGPGTDQHVHIKITPGALQNPKGETPKPPGGAKPPTPKPQPDGQP